MNLTKWNQLGHQLFDLFHPHLSFLAHNKADLPMISTKVLGLSITSKLKSIEWNYLNSAYHSSQPLLLQLHFLAYIQQKIDLYSKSDLVKAKIDTARSQLSYSTPTYPILAWSCVALLLPNFWTVVLTFVLTLSSRI